MKKSKSLRLSLLICLSLMPFTAISRHASNERAGADRAEVIEKEILRLEELGRLKALKGESNWDDLIAEGAYMIAYDGTTIIYQKGLNLPSIPLKSFKLSEMIVRVYSPEVAVVTGLAEVGAETAEKKAFSFQMRFLNVWKKVGGDWKIVVSERTGVKPPAK